LDLTVLTLQHVETVNKVSNIKINFFIQEFDSFVICRKPFDHKNIKNENKMKELLKKLLSNTN
jgi:hypothetical protein